MADLNGMIEDSLMKGLLTKVWVELRETNKSNQALRESRRGSPEESHLMGSEDFGKGAQPLPTCGLGGGSME